MGEQVVLGCTFSLQPCLVAGLIHTDLDQSPLITLAVVRSTVSCTLKSNSLNELRVRVDKKEENSLSA